MTLKLEYYVLRRDKERQIVSVTPGNDPLYGYGSWDLESGPFSSWESAAAASIGSIKSVRKAKSSAANGKLGGRPSLYDLAERRVNHSPKLSPHHDFIMADWPEGNEHWRWVIHAPINEILDWVAAGS